MVNLFLPLDVLHLFKLVSDANRRVESGRGNPGAILGTIYSLAETIRTEEEREERAKMTRLRRSGRDERSRCACTHSAWQSRGGTSVIYSARRRTALRNTRRRVREKQKRKHWDKASLLLSLFFSLFLFLFYLILRYSRPRNRSRGEGSRVGYRR